MRDYDLERLFVEEVGDDAGRLKRQRDDRGVDAAGSERGLQVFGQVLLDVERHLRCERVQRWNQVGQQIGTDRIDDTQFQQADQLIAARLRDFANARRFL